MCLFPMSEEESFAQPPGEGPVTDPAELEPVMRGRQEGEEGSP